MKKTYILLCSLMMVFLVAPISADTSDLGISFEGDSQEFIVFEGNENTSAYEDILPGETRTQKITLKNEDYKDMRFYVRVDESKMLDTGTNSNRIVYDLAFKNNEDIFFEGRVGGTSNAGKENLDENYLLKSLKKGESTTIEMDITFDGTSMDNSYQANLGNLGMVFSVEVDTGNDVIEIIKKIPVLNKIPGVSTGDMTTLNTLLALLGGSAILMILVIVKRKRGKEDETV